MRDKYSGELAVEYCRKELQAVGNGDLHKANVYSWLSDFYRDLALLLC